MDLLILFFFTYDFETFVVCFHFDDRGKYLCAVQTIYALVFICVAYWNDDSVSPITLKHTHIHTFSSTHTHTPPFPLGEPRRYLRRSKVGL